MIFLYAVVFLAPAFIASSITYQLQNRSHSKRRFLTNFSAYSCIILWINTLLLSKRGWNEFAFERLSVQFLTKYLITSIILAYALPFFFKWCDWFIGRFITGKYKPRF